jgi:hypothetical protein
MDLGYGSVIRLVRDSQATKWKSAGIKVLPEAPNAFVRLSNGTLLLVISGSLVSLSADNRLTTLIKKTDWEQLYPNSAVISDDESKLYVGMRQFVGEVDLRSKSLKYLIPNKTFLNKLSKEDEKQVRESLE